MAETQQAGSSRVPTAPYPAFHSLKTLCKYLKEHNVPGRIDRSVLTSFSGAVGSQVITMMKFMGLTDEASVPQDDLHELVAAYDTDAWPSVLERIVRRSYAPMFSINLETASPSQFSEHFRRCYPAADEVSRKSSTFFLNAAREAGIKISPYVMKNKKPRSAPTRKAAPRPKKVNAEGGGAAASRKPAGAAPGGAPPADPPGGAADPAQMLYRMLDPARMNDEEKNAVWTLLLYLKKPVEDMDN